ncbi:MAG: NB-ARC domain-containing protein [Cyanobacteria bacterium J06638_22]
MGDTEPILAAANAAVVHQDGQYLSDVETAILLGAIADQTYEQIAEASGYSINYIKRDIGPKLWRRLSVALGEKVSKTNFQQALKRHGAHDAPAPAPQEMSPPVAPFSAQDWGEAPDVSFFLGRSAELETLRHWILGDRCRLVALLGMGGIGKTTLSVKVAQAVQSAFDLVIWRSLRNAPPLDTLLTQLVPLVSQQQDTQPTLDRLLAHLRTSRCLLVFDNFETILQPQSLGHFRPGYETYGQLLRLVGDTPHSSCLIITSREKPAGIATREGVELAVRSLALRGLETDADELLTAKGISGSPTDREALINRYDGNPLAIKIAATSIQDLFDSDLTRFLAQDTMLFNGVRQLLDQQFNRLSSLENRLMYWLAINRQWTALTTLEEDISPPVPRRHLLEALEALCRRNLLEKQKGSYTQQPVVMEYVCTRLIEQVVDELTTSSLDLCNSHALVKTTVSDYVRESQIRLILDPIAREFQRTFKTTAACKQQILRVLAALRRSEPRLSSYAGGNLLNLCLYIGLDVSGFDFSGLSIWHGCLQRAELHDVSFANADLRRSLLKESFATICTDFSPDGQWLAGGNTQGEIYLRQMSDGQITKLFPAHRAWVRHVTFSPDGQLLASSSHDFTVKIWSLPLEQCLHTFRHEAEAGRLAWSPDSTRLASVGFDQALKLWDVQTGSCLHDLRCDAPQIESVAWSSDGTTLACPSGETTILIWDAQTGERRRTLKGHTDFVWYVDFSPDGRTLASSSQDSHVKLWDVDTGTCLQTVQGNFGLAWCLKFSPDGALLAGAQDWLVRLWETETGRCIQTLQGHGSKVWSVAFSPDGNQLASSGDDQAVKVWDSHTGDCLTTWRGYSNAIRTIAVCPNGRQLASAHQDGSIRLWDTATGSCINVLQGHNGLVGSVAWSPDQALLASASYDKTIKLWDTQTGTCLKTLGGHLNLVFAVIWHPDGKQLASASVDGTIKLWERDTGRCEKTLEDGRQVTDIAWAPSGLQLASGVQDGVLQFWDPQSGECLTAIKAHTHSIFSIAFSPNGKTLATASHDRTIKLWQVSTGDCLKTIDGHHHWVWSVAWSPDGEWLATASQDSTARLWNRRTGACSRVLEGHSNGVRSVRWHPEGQWLVTGSLDETLKLWNPQTGECFKTLRAKRPYEGLNITGITGLTQSQKATLHALGAVETTSEVPPAL